MVSLPREGYVLLRGELSPESLDAFSDCISADLKSVRYKNILQLVNDLLMPLAARTTGAAAPLRPTKVRVSAAGLDESNAGDASTMHRDLVALDYGLLSSSLTVLLYLDDATLELVPGSHLEPQLSLFQLANLPPADKLSLQRGDVVVFSSQLLHRGKFEADPKSRRRLLQCFECFTSGPDPTILHLPSHVSRRAAELHRAPIVRSIASAFGLFNAGTGYGAPHPALLRQGFGFLSSEGARPRLPDDASADSGWLPINSYVYPSPPISDVYGGISELSWSFYGRQYLVLSSLLKLASLIVLLIVVLGMSFFGSK